MNELPKIDGKKVKEFVEWLKKEDMGCCHFRLADTNEYEMDIVVGWHNTGDGWEIAWKIGMQTFNNAMQCDMDVDFIMPYVKETGEVYDTCEIINPTTDEEYDEIAAEMNRVAPKAYKWQLEQEGGTEEYEKVA